MVRPSSLHGNPGPDTYRDISIFDRGPLRREEVPSSTYSVSSSGDVVEGDDIEFVIRRSGGLTSAGSVQFQVKSGSAKFEEDFLTVDGYQTINFDALEASSVNYVEKIITVATVDDEEIEMDEFLMAMLRPSSPYDQIAAMTAHAGKIAEMIKINVGGMHFVTSRSTLCAQDSMLAVMFGGRHALTKDLRDAGHLGVLLSRHVSRDRES